MNYYFLMAKDTIEEEYYEAPIKKKDFSALVLDRHRKQPKEDSGRVRKARKRRA